MNTGIVGSGSQLGTIYQATTGTCDLSKFTDTGVNAQIVGGNIAISSANNYVFTTTLNLNYETVLPRCTYTVAIQPTSRNSNSYGLGIGLRSQATYAKFDIWGYIDPSNGANSGTLYIQTGQNGGAGLTLVATSTAKVPFNAGETLIFSMTRNEDLFTFGVYNLTQQSAPITLSYRFTAYMGSPTAPNISKFGVLLTAGAGAPNTATITSMTATSPVLASPDVAVVGDSKSVGYYAGLLGRGFASLLQQNYRAVTLSGASEITLDVLQRLPEIISLKPASVLLCIGRNDVGNNLPATGPGGYETNYASIVSQLQAAGINVVHLLPLYEPGLDQTALTSFILGNYGAACVDAKLSSYGANALGTDSVHPSDIGHQIVYQAIVAANLLPNFQFQSVQSIPALAAGTVTNDNAAAGQVGEFLSNVVAGGAAIALASGTILNVTTLTLTPGDWDVTGVVSFVAGSGLTTSYVRGGIATASATLGNEGTYITLPYNMTGQLVIDSAVPTVRISVPQSAGTQTVYLIAVASFSGSTLSTFGFLRARRAR